MSRRHAAIIAGLALAIAPAIARAEDPPKPAEAPPADVQAADADTSSDDYKLSAELEQD